MKKIAVFLLLAFLSPLHLEAHELSIKLGAAFAEPMAIESTDHAMMSDGVNTWPITINSTNHKDVSSLALAITADFYYYLHKNLHLGVGFNTELFRHIENSNYGDISYFMPYISIKPNIDIKAYNLYAIAKLGTTLVNYENTYNLHMENTPDIYYAFTAGVGYKNLYFEFVYNIMKWNYDIYFDENTSGHSDITQHTYTFNVGYKFNIF